MTGRSGQITQQGVSMYTGIFSITTYAAVAIGFGFVYLGLLYAGEHLYIEYGWQRSWIPLAIGIVGLIAIVRIFIGKDDFMWMLTITAGGLITFLIWAVPFLVDPYEDNRLLSRRNVSIGIIAIFTTAEIYLGKLAYEDLLFRLPQILDSI